MSRVTTSDRLDVIGHLFIIVIVFACIYWFFTPDVPDAEYLIYITDTQSNTVPNQYTKYNSLTRTQQYVFANLHLGDTVTETVPWNKRKQTPYDRFLSIDYIRYHNRFYEVTAVVKRKPPSLASLIEAILLWIIAIFSLLIAFQSFLYSMVMESGEKESSRKGRKRQ